MAAGYAVEVVRSARGDPSRVRLEGVHALKHAVRFGAELEVVITPAAAELERLLAELAADVRLERTPVVVDRGTWEALVGREPPSPALAIARRPRHTAAEVVGAPGRVVVLEDPRHLGNVGAAVRVAAAAGAGGVLVLGAADPWHPTAVRGAAGLQFALPVARADALPPVARPVVAIAPGGDLLRAGCLPEDPLLLFGTERAGLSTTSLARATHRVGIPMRAGVSSLNLATAVAVTLYA
jgi:RNA methyltransferase, TrmH family